MKPLMMLLMVFSLVGCASGPDVDVCVVNAPAKNRKCYNLKTDYNEDGSLKKTAVPKYRPNLTIDDLNKAMVIDSPHEDPVKEPGHFEIGIARLKAYIQTLRFELEECRAK